MKIHQYRARIDEDALRAWMHRLGESRLGLTAHGLHREVETAVLKNKIVSGKSEFISSKAINDFWNGGVSFKANKHRAYAMTWDYLRGRDDYVEFFPEDLYSQPTPVPRDPIDVLSCALSDFANMHDLEHDFTSAKLREALPGRYVMYRPDLRNAMLGEDKPPRIRASEIEITASEFGLRITERQNFPGTPNQDEHNQENNGVIVPYGRFFVGLMNCKSDFSFKCLTFANPVVDRSFSGLSSGKYVILKGEILVASKTGLFPGVSFFCNRFEGEKPPHHGLIPYEWLDKAALRHINSKEVNKYDK